MIIRKECPLCGKEVAIRMEEEECAKFLYGNGLIQDRLPSMGAVEREFLKTGYCHSCQELIFGGFNKPHMERWIDAEILSLAKKIFGYCSMGCVVEFDDDTHFDFITKALADADKEFIESLKNAETKEEYLRIEIPSNEILKHYMQDGKSNIWSSLNE